jgi:predicted nuclease of predicted toxin-antitoxin system
MRFLADECCDFAAVRFARRGLMLRRSIDNDLMKLALAENRIFPTEDRDFGWLVFAARLESPG